MANLVAHSPPSTMTGQGAFGNRSALPRLAPTAGRSIAFALFFLWLGSYAALALLNIWLWKEHGAITSELLWLEAQRRLLFDVTPANLAVLIQAANPLSLYVVVVAGSALNGAALLGATAITMLAWQLRAVGAPRIWLLLLVLQPTVLLALAQQPYTLLRALFLVIALLAFYGYLQDTFTYQALVGALALGAFTLTAEHLWPLLLSIAVALVVARRRPWREHLTILLITLFPALCLIFAWAYLRLVQGSTTLSSVSATPLVGYVSDGPPALMVLLNGGLIGCGAFVFAAVALLGQSRTTARKGDRSWLGKALLLALPIVDMFWRAGSDAPLVAAALPLFALPLLIQPVRRWRFAQGVIGTLLVLGLFVGWNTALRDTSEPQRMVAQAIGNQLATPLAPYQMIANELNARHMPNQRVLLDSTTLAPLIPLVHDVDALLVPQQSEYALAVQIPQRWVHFVVATDEQQGLDLSHYRLVARQAHLALYELVQH